MSEIQRSPMFGHLLALFTTFVWGTTSISTKVLLIDFTPIEILFIRFVLGFVLLTFLYPKRLNVDARSHEVYFVFAGLSGITFYFLLENIALTYTTASNVGIIITVAPFFTGILSTWFLKAEKPRAQFYIGFVAAIVGIALISYNGAGNVEINPLGDLLSLLAAVAWSIYSILTRKISQFGYNTIQTTRRTFLYGIVFMIPMLFIMDFRLGLERFSEPVNLVNMLFLGACASALCFVTWNKSVRILGAIKASVYIYLVPVVTVATSVIVLNEPLTPMLVVGAALTLLGLWLSETKALKMRSNGRELQGNEDQNSMNKVDEA